MRGGNSSRRGRGGRGRGRNFSSRPRPNYFLSIPLAHFEPIAEHILKIQAGLIQANPDLEGTLVDPASAHLTLFILTLKDPARQSNATEESTAEELPAVEDCSQCLEESVPLLKSRSLLQPITLSFKGLGNFDDEVLFLEVEDGPGLTALHQMAECLAEHFLSQQMLRELPRPFKAHLTVAKTSNLFQGRPHRNARKTKLTPESYASFTEEAIEGTFTVNELQLCRMQGPAATVLTFSTKKRLVS